MSNPSGEESGAPASESEWGYAQGMETKDRQEDKRVYSLGRSEGREAEGSETRLHVC